MNRKAIDVMWTIAKDPDRIQEVVRSGNEYFFKVKGHTMSLSLVTHHEGELYSLFVYPGEVQDLAGFAEYFERQPDFNEVTMSIFRSSEYEDSSAFVELYKVLQNRHQNIDTIFDDILADEDDLEG